MASPTDPKSSHWTQIKTDLIGSTDTMKAKIQAIRDAADALPADTTSLVALLDVLPTNLDTWIQGIYDALNVEDDPKV